MTSPPWSSCVSETETVDCLETESDKQSEETEPQINSDQSVAKRIPNQKYGNTSNLYQMKMEALVTAIVLSVVDCVLKMCQ